MFFYEGQSCPVCGKHFGENDDIVTCPQCGCPHHRDCWKQEGHCHFAADHGTENQWAVGNKNTTQRKASTQKKCRNCGAENPEFAEFCAQCGRDLDHEDWAAQTQPPHAQYTPPTTPTPFRNTYQVPLQDPYGGVPRNTEIDGITVDEIVELVGPNSAYYMPRFWRMSQGKSKLSFNWAGFLLPHNWLLFRKNILWGVLASVVWTAICITGYFVLLMEGTALSAEAQAMLSLISTICTVVELALRFTVGFLGNYAYMQTILNKARKLREHPQPQYNRSFSVSGGTSMALAIIPYVIPILIAYAIVLFSPIS